MARQLAQELFKIIKTGNLDELQKMYEENPIIITDPEYFCTARIDGYLHIERWLFRAACIDGHLHIAQWLLQIKPDIDISERNEQVFRFACDFDQLHIAKWLLEVKPNINVSICKDVAFKSACFEDRTEIAEWLHKIRPYHYILKVNNKNQILHYNVRTIQKRKWLERREPLMAHYNKKERNVFWKLPYVIVRHMCEYI